MNETKIMAAEKLHTQRNGLLYALNYVYGPFYDSNHAAVWARRKTEHENAATLSSWMQG